MFRCPVGLHCKICWVISPFIKCFNYAACSYLRLGMGVEMSKEKYLFNRATWVAEMFMEMSCQTVLNMKLSV
jgi:hypothetical protein